MIQYRILDNLIIDRIERSCGGCTLQSINHNPIVYAELQRIAEATGRLKFRILDGRLQALRKSGRLEFDINRGWTIRSVV